MPYRALHDMMLGDQFQGAASLEAWLHAQGAEVEWLRSFGERGRPDVEADCEDLWRLYGLSRVLDTLALSFQTGRADGSDWPGPGVPVYEWCSFAERLGLTVHVPQRFSPFDCEIFRAENGSNPDQPITLAKVHWPCLMLGPLLICRAGVSVIGGRGVFSAPVAQSSKLYWTYRRKYRPHEDLSHGWGSNSQWRTSFRRDYRMDGRLHYNVDGTHDLSQPGPAGQGSGGDESALSTRERLELLVHRCFIRVDQQHLEPWPYHDKVVLSEGASVGAGPPRGG